MATPGRIAGNVAGYGVGLPVGLLTYTLLDRTAVPISNGLLDGATNLIEGTTNVFGDIDLRFEGEEVQAPLSPGAQKLDVCSAIYNSGDHIAAAECALSLSGVDTNLSDFDADGTPTVDNSGGYVQLDITPDSVSNGIHEAAHRLDAAPTTKENVSIQAEACQPWEQPAAINMCIEGSLPGVPAGAFIDTDWTHPDLEPGGDGIAADTSEGSGTQLIIKYDGVPLQQGSDLVAEVVPIEISPVSSETSGYDTVDAVGGVLITAGVALGSLYAGWRTMKRVRDGVEGLLT